MFPSNASSSGQNETFTQLTDEEKDTGLLAQREFDRGNYDMCINHLNKLTKTRPSDPKVLHNKEVALYFKSGLRKTDEFLAMLKQICEMMKVSIDKVQTLDDVEQAVPFFNNCVIRFRLQQFQRAVSGLEKILQFVDPLDEKLGQKVLFLLIEQYLCLQKPQRAMHFIIQMEKSFLNSKINAEASGNPQEKEKVEQQLLAVQSRLSHFKTRCFIMMGNLRMVQDEMKVLASYLGNNASMLYMKAHMETMHGNPRKAVILLNTNPQQVKRTHETGEHLTTMYYNNLGVIHFHMKKHNLGAFYFRKALQENTQIVTEFHKVDLNKCLSGRQLPTLSVNKHQALLYNMGVQLLHCGHPSAAFDCLIETMQLYSTNPRLWLRLAECCIQSFRVSNEEDQKLSSRLKVIQASVGTGVHKKLVFGSGYKEDRRSVESAGIPNTTLEFGALCLRNALYLIPSKERLTAAALDPEKADYCLPACPSNPMGYDNIEDLRSSVYACSAFISLSLGDYVLAQKYAADLLNQARLSGALRYVGQMYLAEAQIGLDRIGDAIRNLNPDTVNDISLSIPDGDKRQGDEIEKSKSTDKDDNTEDSGARSEDRAVASWYPTDLKLARAVMAFNLATAYAIRGETDKAMTYLRLCMEAMEPPYPVQLYFLHIYLEVLDGRRHAIDNILKEFFGHMIASRPTS